MSLYETCLSLNVGLHVCIVEHMITFTQVHVYLFMTYIYEICVHVYIYTYICIYHT